MNISALIESIEQTPPPPCDGCDKARSCALKTLACRDFFLYVTDEDQRGSLPMARTSIARVPTREIYDTVFSDDSYAHTRMSRGGPLKPEIVESIRASTGTLRAVAREHGVDKSTVLRIRKQIIYKKPLIESSVSV